MTNSALQVTNFDFYGDGLIAVKENATNEVYVSINSILRGIGFAERQVTHNHNKWCKDIVISKGTQNFAYPTNGGLQKTSCISIKKLPYALAKINITSKMKQFCL